LIQSSYFVPFTKKLFKNDYTNNVLKISWSPDFGYSEEVFSNILLPRPLGRGDKTTDNPIPAL
jgi:hypothetical protein